MTLASEGLKIPAKLHTIRQEPQPVPVADGITVSQEFEPDDSELVHNDDGSITVQAKEKTKKIGKKNFNDNLAEELDDMELSRIASDLLMLIESDIRSRQEWEDTFNKGVDLLGLKIESPTSDVTGGGNISKVKDPLLLEAVLRYQSNFHAEMLPTDGPVKVRDDHVEPPVPPQPPAAPGAPAPMGGPMQKPDISRNELANAFQTDINYYLTNIDKPYYPDTDRMSFSQGLGGCAFKKIYRDPIEERPVSRFVMAPHLIVNNGASSLHDAKRQTHLIPDMSPLMVKKMQLAGVYRDVDLSVPVSNPGSVDAKIAETEGRSPNTNQPEDKDYTIYECYCYLNLPGFEHKDGLELPYRVTIEKDSRVILEIRRFWYENDKNFKQRRLFVKFPLFPGLGFYDYGFVHILGNTTRVLSAIESLMVDAGMFANFPGGLIDQSAVRQDSNQIRPGPGGFKAINTGGRPLSACVMPMPYKDVGPGILALAQGLKANGEKLASISELPVGEGRADVPVGTVLALIEQNTKLLSAVHKRNHQAQQEEFEILKELFAEDPSALTKLAKNPARQWEEKEEFEDLRLVPASDPNASSQIMRIARAQAVVQMAQQSPPGLFNPKEVAMRALKVLGIEDAEGLFLPPPPPGSQPPAPHQLDAQMKQQQMQQQTVEQEQDNQFKAQELAVEMQDKDKDRQNKLQLQQMKLQEQAMKDANEFRAGVTPPNSLASSQP